MIDLIYEMHDGFNLNLEEVPPKEGFVASPQVVVETISLLKSREWQFFPQRLYMKSGRHSSVILLFLSMKEEALKRQSRKMLNEIILNG